MREELRLISQSFIQLLQVSDLTRIYEHHGFCAYIDLCFIIMKLNMILDWYITIIIYLNLNIGNHIIILIWSIDVI